MSLDAPTIARGCALFLAFNGALYSLLFGSMTNDPVLAIVCATFLGIGISLAVEETLIKRRRT
jgi:hypothetical protein